VLCRKAPRWRGADRISALHPARQAISRGMAMMPMAELAE